MPLPEWFKEVPKDSAKKSGLSDWFKPVTNPAGKSAGRAVAEDKEAANSVPPPPPCAFHEDFVFWAMRRIPVVEATKHFLACGSTGAGKTTVIDLLVQSIAPRFYRDRSAPEQLIIFDSKGDALPKLASLGLRLDNDDPDSNVWLINPNDERSAIWDIAEAMQSPLMARHFAALLIPEEPKSNAPFFWRASRLLVRAVILGLNRIAGTKWGLRDLILALSSRDSIKAIAFRHERGQKLAAIILSDERHADAVISQVMSTIDNLEQVAALWDTAPSGRKFSIEKFLKKPGVLILGDDAVLHEGVWPINALLLKALSKEILRQPESRKPKFWFVLDEFAAMQRVEAVTELVNRGRSKGASVLIGIQGIDRLNALYGEAETADLLEQLTYKTFLRAGGPNTAEWIERYFGKYRREEAVLTQTFGPQYSWSWQYTTAERSTFLSSFFSGLPATGPKQLLVTVNDIPCLGAVYVTTRAFDEVNQWRAVPDYENTPDVMPRSKMRDQELQPWDEVDLCFFCGKDFAGEATKDNAQNFAEGKEGKKPRLPNRPK